MKTVAVKVTLVRSIMEKKYTLLMYINSGEGVNNELKKTHKVEAKRSSLFKLELVDIYGLFFVEDIRGK